MGDGPVTCLQATNSARAHVLFGCVGWPCGPPTTSRIFVFCDNSSCSVRCCAISCGVHITRYGLRSVCFVVATFVAIRKDPVAEEVGAAGVPIGPTARRPHGQLFNNLVSRRPVWVTQYAAIYRWPVKCLRLGGKSPTRLRAGITCAR